MNESDAVKDRPPPGDSGSVVVGQIADNLQQSVQTSVIVPPALHEIRHAKLGVDATAFNDSAPTNGSVEDKIISYTNNSGSTNNNSTHYPNSHIAYANHNNHCHVKNVLQQQQQQEENSHLKSALTHIKHTNNNNQNPRDESQAVGGMRMDKAKVATNEPGTNALSYTVSSTSSEASSVASSLSTSPQVMLYDEESSDTRKVEPLIINLHREPIRTVIKLGATTESNTVQAAPPPSPIVQVPPKITIKPIPKPEPVPIDEDGVREVDVIPKLHIRMNHHMESQSTQMENHTVQQAGAINNIGPVPGMEPAANVVPKLTLKMFLNNHMEPQVKVTDEGTKVKIKKVVEPPLPKLTIKTPLAAASTEDHLTVPKLTIKVPSSADSCSSKTKEDVDNEQYQDVKPVSSIPKLTLKNVSKVGGEFQILTNSSSSCEATTTTIMGASETSTTVPKLKVKLPTRSSAAAGEDNSSHHQQQQQHHHHHHPHQHNQSIHYSSPHHEHQISSTTKGVVASEDHSDGVAMSAAAAAVNAEPAMPPIPKLTIKPVPKTYGTNSNNEFINNYHHQTQHHFAINNSITENISTRGCSDYNNSSNDSNQCTNSGIQVMAESSSRSNSSSNSNSSNSNANSNINNTLGLSEARVVIKPIPKPVNVDVESMTKTTAAAAVVETGKSADSNELLQVVCPSIDSSSSNCPSGANISSPQSPRIILKINMNQNSVVSNTTGQESTIDALRMNAQALGKEESALLKRHLTHEHEGAVAKRKKRQVESVDGKADVYQHAEENGRLIENDHRMEELVNRAKEEKLVPETVGGDDGKGQDLEQSYRTPVKRSRGRPRKTPIVPKELTENLLTVANKRGKRSKKSEESTPFAEINSAKVARIIENEDLSQSLAPIYGSRRGSGRVRGRGGGRKTSPRKPFNKERYFKQKTLEESILNSYLEEETRMSADITTTPKSIGVLPSPSLLELNPDSISQSSHISSTSVTLDGSSNQTPTASHKKKLKMEVVGTLEGKTEFTVDMLAEYDWPPGIGCCPNKNRDTYMIQEQIAEYLGVKSFKRKYPDLERRTIEMEERDFLIERGLCTEKLCDLGVTAVYAVDVLDIMYQDFHDKYEAYKQYHREKVTRDISLRQKLQRPEGGTGAREKAIRSVSNWNTNLNKTRQEERRIHMDLQNFVIQVPEAKRRRMTFEVQKPSNYPIAVVPGQFAEYYRTFSSLELQCYPINTALIGPEELMKRLLDAKMEAQEQQQQLAQTEDEKSNRQSVRSGSSSSDGSSSSSDGSGSDSSECDSTDSSTESEYDVNAEDTCSVCIKTQYTSPLDRPELFVKCAMCKNTAHPSCIEMSSKMAQRALQYEWQCVECKSCYGCQSAEDKQKMLFCDQCDRAYHIYCTKLNRVPEDRWHCDICAICTRCGCRNPDGSNESVSKVAALLSSPVGAGSSGHGGLRPPAWKHEYRVDKVTQIREHYAMYCVRCAAVLS